MQCFGSHSLLSPAGGRPTQDAQELRRAMARSEIARVSVNASATSAGARHISCARGLRPAASRRKEPPMSNNKDTLAHHAHTMRQAPTDSEARLWRALRSSQLGVAWAAPPFYVVVRPGVLALRAARAGGPPTPASPDVGAPTAAPRRV